jgi:hypothetical protein
MKLLPIGALSCLIAAALAPLDALAAFVESKELARGDVQSSIENAIADLTGGQVVLNRIVAIYQPSQTNLKENSETVQNIAFVLATLSGSIPQAGGVPFVYDDTIEQIFCQQTTNDRWLCFFSVLGSLVGSSGVDSFFFLEE